MKPALIALALRVGLVTLATSVAGFAAAAGPAQRMSQQQATREVHVSLPPGTTSFPPGPGSDLADQHCVVCHSAGMVLRQPPLSFDEWKAEAAKMRTVYGAPFPAENIDAIARYLNSINGKQ